MKIARIVLAMTLLNAWIGTAQADVSDGLDSMFLATGNEPAVYESQRRYGVDLGTFRLRSPVSTINLVNYTAPTLRGGCGGIDLWSGSFSFINLEEFRQILRQIGANAIGYAFKLALATMCEVCDRILTGLQDQMNKINQMNVDSCRWAQGFVNDAITSAGLQGRVKGMEGGSAAGMIDDFVQGLRDEFADAGRWLHNNDPSGADPDNKDVGNLTWNALLAAGSASKITFTAGNIDNNELLMNIAGSFIVASGTEAERTAGQNGDRNGPIEARLTFGELRMGKGEDSAGTADANPLWTCTDNAQCLQLAPLAGAWSFPGVDAWVAERLNGLADRMMDVATAGQDYSADDQAFLGSLPIDVARHFVELQGNPGIYKYVASMSDYIAEAYAVHLGDVLLGLIVAAYERTDTPTMKENVRANLERFRLEVENARLNVAEKYQDQILKTEELVQTLTLRNREKAPAMVSGAN